MLTKLKYAGVRIEDLLQFFCLFLCSSAEYCSVAFHDSLTAKQSHSIERIQIIALKIILGDSYIDYSSALEMCGFKTLQQRREERTLAFGKKCISHPNLKQLFPLNTAIYNDKQVRSREVFNVNFARTESYKKSAIPSIQRRLNKHYKLLQ